MERKLERGISETQISWVTIGGIIGSCYFLGAGLILESLGPLAPIAFAFAGLIVFAVMQAMAELQVNLPRESSFVGYSKEFLGSPIACGIGVTYVLNWMFYIPSEAVAGGTISNLFVATVPAEYFAVFFLILIVGLNLVHVKSFAIAETVMAMAKVSAIILFCIFALFAVFGIFTSPVGLSILVPEIAEKKAMMGVGILGAMVFAGQMLLLMFNQTPILLVNYQGSEIIGLASAETRNPEVSIPKSAKNTAYRIVGMFVIPMFLLCLIFPASKAGVASSVFADALAANGFGWLGILFTIVVLISAFSCANSGFYAGVRTIRGLAVEGLLPKFLISLNAKNAPQNAAILMAAGCCLTMAGSILFGESNIFASLLSMSGITGALCWISFGVCLYIYRRKMKANGYGKADVKSPANLVFVMLLAVVVQSAGIISLAFSGTYQLPFFISSGLMVAAMVIYKICEVTGRTRTVEAVHKGEKSFDELFPKRKVSGTLVVGQTFEAGIMEKIPTAAD